MHNQSYFITGDPANSDIEIKDKPLWINCAGYAYMEKPFTTSGIRKDYYLQIMDNGVLREGIDSDKTLSAGQFILRSPNTAYRYGLEENTPEMGYFWIHFSGNDAMRILSDYGIETNKIYDLDERYFSRVKEYFTTLFRELMLKKSGYIEMTQSLLTAITVKLGRGIHASPPENPRKRLEGCAEYINAHYTEKINVDTLAASAHLSVSRFRELFSLTFGESPSNYITSLRINRAKEILATTDLNVTETAELCGYTDELYFSRIFRKKTGLSPTSYRKTIMI